MTDAEIVRANEELDRLCAERVMEWHPGDGGKWWIDVNGMATHCKVGVWSPSTKDAACWQMVEKLTGSGWCMRMQTWASEGEWLCELWRMDPAIAVHKLPIYSCLGERRRSICLACLRAVGVEV